MIEYIKGDIAEITPATVVLDCNGMGYGINISLNTYSAIQNQSNTKLYIYEAIREDAYVLYGFSTKAGLEAIVRAVHETRNTDNADFGEVLFRIRIVCVPIHITSLPPVPAFCGLQTLFSSSLLSYLYGFVPCRTGCAPILSILQSPYGHWVA